MGVTLGAVPYRHPGFCKKKKEELKRKGKGKKEQKKRLKKRKERGKTWKERGKKEKGRASSAPLSQENNDSKEFKRFVNCCVEQNNRGKLSQCTVQLSCSSYCPQVCTVHDFQSTTLQISKPRVSRITFSDFQNAEK